MPASAAAAAALLRNGAEPDARDARGLSAIILAAAVGNAAVVERLALAGADCGGPRGNPTPGSGEPRNPPKSPR